MYLVAIVNKVIRFVTFLNIMKLILLDVQPFGCLIIIVNKRYVFYRICFNMRYYRLFILYRIK